MKFLKLVKSENPDKKYDVYLLDEEGKQHKVSFGASGYSDFTKHKDESRKLLYLERHRKREDWTKSGF